MGTKMKSWYHLPYFNTEWLFKQPTEGTGEHWAEKISAEVARLLGVAHPKVEMATVEGVRGTMTESFASQAMELIHGNEILTGIVPGYEKAKVYGQSQHTLANILLVLDKVFQSQPGVCELAKRRFAEYLTLDALIGNVDRHHENWGLHRNRAVRQFSGFLAPSFDHASSLGRELRDEGSSRSRDELLAGDRIGVRYVERGHGGIFWSEDERRAPSPLELVRRASASYPELFRTANGHLGRVGRDALYQAVERVPETWMSASARSFSIAMLEYNVNELRKVFQ